MLALLCSDWGFARTENQGGATLPAGGWKGVLGPISALPSFPQTLP